MNALEVLNTLRVAESRIAQLCNTVNTLAGFKKVQARDFTEELRALRASIMEEQV